MRRMNIIEAPGIKERSVVITICKRIMITHPYQELLNELKSSVLRCTPSSKYIIPKAIRINMEIRDIATNAAIIIRILSNNFALLLKKSLTASPPF